MGKLVDGKWLFDQNDTDPFFNRMRRQGYKFGHKINVSP